MQFKPLAVFVMCVPKRDSAGALPDDEYRFNPPDVIHAFTTQNTIIERDNLDVIVYLDSGDGHRIMIRNRLDYERQKKAQAAHAARAGNMGGSPLFDFNP